MKIPKTVKIGWRNYVVEIDNEMYNDDGQLLLGQIDYDNQKIYLNDTFHPDTIRVTLLHEILHGIFYTQGHGDWRMDENLIDAVSEGLYGLVVDNPEVFIPEKELKTSYSCIVPSGCCG